jgi:hypothetical protein
LALFFLAQQQHSMASVGDLDDAQLSSAVYQIVMSKRFTDVNAHLSAAEMRALRDNLQWPGKPVFSPYVGTKDGEYSQGMFWSRDLDL